MKMLTLEFDEFAAVIGFLNATKLVGMDEGLIQSFSEVDVNRVMAKLEKNGWLSTADSPNTWHIDEHLMQCLAVAIAPHFAVLARSKPHRKSILFYIALDEITEIVVTDKNVVVVELENVGELAKQVFEFLDRLKPCEVVVARVKADKLDSGHRVSVDAEGKMTSMTPSLLPVSQDKWNEENISMFVRNAIADLKT
jgi:hypothetical protein